MFPWWNLPWNSGTWRLQHPISRCGPSPVATWRHVWPRGRLGCFATWSFLAKVAPAGCRQPQPGLEVAEMYWNMLGIIAVIILSVWLDIPTYLNILNWQFSENGLIWLPLGSRMCPIWVSQVAHLLTSDLAEVGLNRVQIRQLQKLAGSSGVAWRSSYGCHIRLRTYSIYPSINLSIVLSFLSFSYLSYLSCLSFLFFKMLSFWSF